MPVAESADDIYATVRGQNRFLFRALSSYIYPMLRLRRRLPSEWVRRQYLPVGNPETTFVFDAVERGERLRISIPPDVLQTHRVMFTAYNRASFPTLWFRIMDAETQTEAMPSQGFWLLRLHPMIPKAPSIDLETIVISRTAAER